MKLILRVGSLHLGQLGVHVFVAGGQVQLGGALLQNLVLDHLVQDVQPPDVGLLRRRFLRVVSQAALVIALQIGR